MSLEGDLKSNNKKAVPSLYIDQSGDTLTIKLYKDNSLFFGLIKSGSVHFNAVLPEYFDGEIDMRTSSGYTTASGINAKTVGIKSSSGDIDAAEIEAERISLGASSGTTTAFKLSAVDSISVKSSSGDISIDEMLSGEAEVRASSGRIEIGRLRAAGGVTVHASSGRITADYLEGKTVKVDASSGRISLKQLRAEETAVEASSGDISIADMIGGASYIRASSGEITAKLGELNGDLEVKSSSGDVNLELPSGTGFDADLSASSGRIRSTFKLLGEVSGSRKNEVAGEANGGGYRLRVNASSGDISVDER